LSLFHKQRGRKGMWSEISNLELIRVTKGIGKRLKLVLKCKEPFEWEDVQLHLYELDNSQILERQFAIEAYALKHLPSESATSKVTTTASPTTALSSMASSSTEKLCGPPASQSATTSTLFLPYDMEVEVKVYDLCRIMQFYATVHTKSGRVLNCCSVQFSTHDSGKQRKRSPPVKCDVDLLESLNGSAHIINAGVNHPKSDCDNNMNSGHCNTSNNVATASISPSATLSSSPEHSFTPPSPSPLDEVHWSHPTSPFSFSLGASASSLSQPPHQSSSSSLSSSSPPSPPPPPSSPLPSVPSAVPTQQPSALTLVATTSSSEPINNTNFVSLCENDESQTQVLAEKKRKLNQLTSSAPVEDGFQHFCCEGSLDVKGVVRAKGFLQYSDLRLKTNMEDIIDALNIVMHLQGKRYEWKENVVQGGDDSKAKKVIGFIAQEVRRVLPEVVHEDERGFLSVSYSDLVPLLVEALKQHIKNYEQDKNTLQSEISALRERLECLALKSDDDRVTVREELETLKVTLMTHMRPSSSSPSLSSSATSVASPPPTPPSASSPSSVPVSISVSTSSVNGRKHMRRSFPMSSQQPPSSPRTNARRVSVARETQSNKCHQHSRQVSLNTTPVRDCPLSADQDHKLSTRSHARNKSLNDLEELVEHKVSLSSSKGGHDNSRGHARQSSLGQTLATLFMAPTSNSTSYVHEAKASQPALLYVPAFESVSDCSQRAISQIQAVCIIALNGWIRVGVNGGSVNDEDAQGWAEREAWLYARHAEHAVRETLPATVDIWTHALANEGSVTERYKHYTRLFDTDSTLKQHLTAASAVWFVCHSQSVPVGIMLVHYLIGQGLLRPLSSCLQQPGAAQRISVLAMAGLHHASSQDIVRLQLLCSASPRSDTSTAPSSSAAVSEPFDSSAPIFEQYVHSLHEILEKGVTLTALGAYGDSVIDLCTSVLDWISHPSILRGIYVHPTHHDAFEPHTAWKKPNNFVEELILFALAMRNMREEADLLRFIISPPPELHPLLPKKVFRYISQSKLRQLLFGTETTNALSSFRAFFVYMGSPLALVCPWGYKLYRACCAVRQGIDAHRGVANCTDAYRVAWEWLLACSYDTKTLPPKPIQLVHNVAIAFDLRNSDLETHMHLFENHIRQLQDKHADWISRVRAAFEYWKPCNTKEQNVHQVLHQHLQWPTNERFLGQYVDQFVERLAIEAEKQVEVLRNSEALKLTE